ncbi:T9SS type A sorting domain-containing protein [Chryseobacterium profundimaris]|uniref:Por secretion system C-terminal sorting domain-containing protein n=1 Tax=Chryseobacterium profundimaris TaxID=1387275 RepID=A0ABY1P2Z6_9FLAO|nr:T9SS type A sorting domain-containing protein [Chryseobacterium profundimaris]SMP23604.1 Por secretion system C-terminal sorting domain-containing protein [Chryseobacterium profundimaris]
MQKILSLTFTFIVALCFAQFTANDVKFFVGSGTQTAYIVVDFKDGTDDRSYAWGVRFNAGESLSINNLLQRIQAAEPQFTYQQSAGFLNTIQFNDHYKTSGPDWWSTWSGTSSSTFLGNGGIGGNVQDGRWYGFSYGFSNPSMQPPATPIPAYSSLWYNASQITNWIGTGSSKSLVVVDFGTDNSAGNADSFVFGIQYNGTITAEQALQLIDNYVDSFTYSPAANQVAALLFNSFSGTANGTNTWKLYKGTNLSDWKTHTSLSSITLNNNDWLGLSFGTRRPFTPSEANATLSVSNIVEESFKIYPNPASDFIIIETKDNIKDITVYSITGQKVLNTKNKKINVQHLKSGVYLAEIKTDKSTTTHKFIKI